ncbi:MAG: hypothetical protein J7527_12665 [Chitinophagaceae bacterium]|nr:hypothetical protein [Chitinophagaceae bacterium]
MPRRIYHIQYISAIVLLAFVSLPLTDFLAEALTGSPSRGNILKSFEDARINRAFEAVLFVTIVTHVYTALYLSREWSRQKMASWQWIRLFSGLYLSIFLFIHVGAVICARLIFGIETGFYSGAAGMNTYPLKFAFLIYASLLTVFFSAKLTSAPYRQSLVSPFTLHGIRAGILLISVTISFAVAAGYSSNSDQSTTIRSLVDASAA